MSLPPRIPRSSAEELAALYDDEPFPIVVPAPLAPLGVLPRSSPPGGSPGAPSPASLGLIPPIPLASVLGSGPPGGSPGQIIFPGDITNTEYTNNENENSNNENENNTNENDTNGMATPTTRTGTLSTISMRSTGGRRKTRRSPHKTRKGRRARKTRKGKMSKKSRMRLHRGGAMYPNDDNTVLTTLDGTDIDAVPTVRSYNSETDNPIASQTSSV